MKTFIKKLLTPILGQIGFVHRSVEKKQSTPAPKLLDTCFKALESIGFRPKHIVDVGANHGNWTRTALRHFPDAYFTLLEPQAALRTSIQPLLDINPRIQLHSVGAGEKSGSFKFTIAEKDHSSSFRFSSDEAARLGRQQIEVPVVTLEGLLAESTLPTPELIKVDAEGWDLAVLRGAGRLFGQAEVILVEVSVANKMFENDVASVIDVMKEHGYRLFDITDLNRTQKHGALWLMEVAFAKRGGMVDQAISNYYNS